MVIKEFNADYQVLDYSINRSSGKINLKWNYKHGRYFLIFLYDARNSLNLEKIMQELEQKQLDDRTLIERNSAPIYTTSNGTEKIFLCRESEYVQNNQTYCLPVKELKNGVPYAISIYITEYDRDTGVLYLYPVKDSEINTQFIPVKVNPNISYKNKLFSSTKMCTLNVPHMYDYPDGALEYYVTGVGVKVEYPIPAECLGKELLVLIPKDSEVVVRAADKYKKYYRA